MKTSTRIPLIVATAMAATIFFSPSAHAELRPMPFGSKTSGIGEGPLLKTPPPYAARFLNRAI